MPGALSDVEGVREWFGKMWWRAPGFRALGLLGTWLLDGVVAAD